jgi:hypothetical protein
LKPQKNKVKKALLSVLLFLILVLILAGCAGKETVRPVLSKTEAISAVRGKAVTLCEYGGRVRITYSETTDDEQRYSGLLEKTCAKDMRLRVLGPFGVVLAEVSVRNGTYRATKGKEDITADLSGIIGRREISLMASALTFPPPLPDSSYEYGNIGNLAVFRKGDLTLITDNDMNISTIIRPKTVTKYVWKKDRPVSAAMKWNDQEIKLDFYGEWK